MFCKNCGNELADGEKFCGKCGATVTPNARQAVVEDALVGRNYRFQYCNGNGPTARMRGLLALAIYSIVIYFAGDSVDFTFQKNTLRIRTSYMDQEEPYESIHSIYFQENVPTKRGFPLMISIVLSLAISWIVGVTIADSLVIGVLLLILTLGVSGFLKFGNVKRTVLCVEYKDGKKLCFPMKHKSQKVLERQEQFLQDVKAIGKSR